MSLRIRVFGFKLTIKLDIVSKIYFVVGYEQGSDVKKAEIASEVLVSMFTGINETLHLPVAYYFTNNLKADLKSTLFKNIIETIIETGVRLHSVTFDGFSANPVVVKNFGADMDVFSESFNPSFIMKNHENNVFLDPSHIMKLIGKNDLRDSFCFSKKQFVKDVSRMTQGYHYLVEPFFQCISILL